MLIRQVVDCAVKSEHKFYVLGLALKIPYHLLFFIITKTMQDLRCMMQSVPITNSLFLQEAGTRLMRVARNVYFR